MRYIKKKGYKTVTDFYLDIAQEKLELNDVIEEYLESIHKENEPSEASIRSAEEYVTTTEAAEIATSNDHRSSGNRHQQGCARHRQEPHRHRIYACQMLQPDLWRRGVRVRLHAWHQDTPHGLPERARDVQPVRIPHHPRKMEREGGKWLHRHPPRGGKRRYCDRDEHYLRDRKRGGHIAPLVEYQLRRWSFPRELYRPGKRYRLAQPIDQEDQHRERREASRAAEHLSKTSWPILPFIGITFSIYAYKREGSCL